MGRGQKMFASTSQVLREKRAKTNVTTHNFKVDERPVRNDGRAHKIIALSVRLQQDGRVRHRGPIQVAQCRYLDCLFEMHWILPIQSTHLQMRVPLHAHAKSLILNEPGVEHGKCIHVQDLSELRNIHHGLGRGRHGGEIDASKGRLRWPVFQEHDTLKGVNHGVDRVISLDGAVDGEREIGGLCLG